MNANTAATLRYLGLSLVVAQMAYTITDIFEGPARIIGIGVFGILLAWAPRRS